MNNLPQGSGVRDRATTGCVLSSTSHRGNGENFSGLDHRTGSPLPGGEKVIKI
ncbi:MAG: hypothetical protein ACKO4L_12550 [Nodosilinea sp.]